MHCTRNLEIAKQYCKDRYENEPTKRYGIIVSSKAKGLKKYGLDGSYIATKDLDYGKWYNSPPDNPNSCCSLNQRAPDLCFL